MVAMIVWGRSSDQRKERIWHVALPSLAAALGFAVASIAQGALVSLLALSVAVIGLYATLAPLISLPASFLGGRAAAGGISLVYAIANVGAFLGPTVIGVLRERSGDYASGMAALAIALLISAMIVLVIGRKMSQTKVAAQIIAKR
jgi:ACS family tartrate transporter-like MFS transporter